jgi:hypothetical protein
MSRFKRPFVISSPTILEYCIRELRAEALRRIHDGKALGVELSDPTRSLEQNSAQWPILQAWADQKAWPVNGEQTHLDKEDWKTILTASFRAESPRVTPGLNGGMILLGLSTRKMKVNEFSEWLEWLIATSVQMGVKIDRQTEAEPEGRMCA